MVLKLDTENKEPTQGLQVMNKDAGAKKNQLRLMAAKQSNSILYFTG
jgi:hypothetical protein